MNTLILCSPFPFAFLPPRNLIELNNYVTVTASWLVQHWPKQTILLRNQRQQIGPYKINGVPLRRVDQAYVIATSTKVELPALPDSLTDGLFKRKPKPTKNEKEMFVENTAEVC